MNQLARFIHSLVTDKNNIQLFTLSQEEQAAISDLKPLLTLQPQKLSKYLENNPTADWWIVLPSDTNLSKQK